MNTTRPETIDFQTRADETPIALNPTRPDFLKKFKTDPTRKFYINETMELVKEVSHLV